MLLLPLALFFFLLTSGTWSSGRTAWRRSCDPLMSGWFRTGLRIRATIMCGVSLLPLAGSFGCLLLAWLWFKASANTGRLYGGEVAVYALFFLLNLLIVLLTLLTLLRYQQGRPYVDSVTVRMLLQVVSTLLFPGLLTLWWPLTGWTTGLFLLLGGGLIWFDLHVLHSTKPAKTGTSSTL